MLILLLRLSSMMSSGDDKLLAIEMKIYWIFRFITSLYAKVHLINARLTIYLNCRKTFICIFHMVTKVILGFSLFWATLLNIYPNSINNALSNRKIIECKTGAPFVLVSDQLIMLSFPGKSKTHEQLPIYVFMPLGSRRQSKFIYFAMIHWNRLKLFTFFKMQ